MIALSNRGAAEYQLSGASASRAAFRLPSPAEKIDPSSTCARPAQTCKLLRLDQLNLLSNLCTIAQIFARWTRAASRTGLPTFDFNRTLMKEHPSS
jgi:hypothetical protein